MGVKRIRVRTLLAAVLAAGLLISVAPGAGASDDPAPPEVPESRIVGGTQAWAVRTDDWSAAFSALNAAGAAVMLSGRDVRVADADPDELRSVLGAAGLHADITSVPATIEERMMVLARQHPDPA